MQCPRCQHDNQAGVKFCGKCGARLGSMELLADHCPEEAGSYSTG